MDGLSKKKNTHKNTHKTSCVRVFDRANKKKHNQQINGLICLIFFVCAFWRHLIIAQNKKNQAHRPTLINLKTFFVCVHCVVVVADQRKNWILFRHPQSIWNWLNVEKCRTTKKSVTAHIKNLHMNLINNSEKPLITIFIYFPPNKKHQHTYKMPNRLRGTGKPFEKLAVCFSKSRSQFRCHSQKPKQIKCMSIYTILTTKHTGELNNQQPQQQ